MPTLAFELETVLHGQLAGNEAADALILVAITDHPDRNRLACAQPTSPAPPPRSVCPVAGLLSPTTTESFPPN